MTRRPDRRSELDLKNIDEGPYAGIDETGRWPRPPDRDVWIWLGPFLVYGWVGQEMVRSSGDLSVGGFLAGLAAMAVAYWTAWRLTNGKEGPEDAPTEETPKAAQSRVEPRSPRAP